MTTDSGAAAAAGGLRRPVFWLSVVVLVAVDLISKAWVWSNVQGEVFLAGRWLSLRKVYNPGGVFGLFQDFTLPLTLIRIVAVVAIVGLVARQPRRNRLGVATLALLLAGALGNLYDNLGRWTGWVAVEDERFLGSVRDFVKVDLGFWPLDPWPVFNFADACISVGFVLLVLGLARIQLKAARPEPC
ncbi:MAG: signal peptidase II [Planctomycetota bacterium]|nr:MAG: signal peptidase II [Planctomycetota bacterium]